jgi:hypothetical protein
MPSRSRSPAIRESATISAAGKFNLYDAGERLVRLYAACRKPEQAWPWDEKLGLADLPTDAFEKP